MKLHSHNNSLETNSQDIESQEFGISESGVIIDILRNRLYEFKIRTSVQEIVSNAKDAMKEVGKGNEFEITVPTRLNPVFRVRDFGPSISPDRMNAVFIKYGSSTKRNDNTQIGGFGIGGKSLFSVSDSFTIVTFLDGLRRSYIAHIGVNSQGRLDLISTDASDEPTGTEISVAVKPGDIEEFRKAVFRAIYFWKDKPKLKGELDTPVLIQGEVISDTLEVISSDLLPEYVRGDYYDKMTAVIDGICYPISQKLIDKVKPLHQLHELAKHRVILHMPSGLVEVAASRESIADSKHTLNALEKIGQKALLEAQIYIANHFAKVNSTAEYLKTYVTVSKAFNVDNFAKYQGYTIRQGAIESDLFKKVKITEAHKWGKFRGCRSRRNKVDKISRDPIDVIDIDRFDRIFFTDGAESSLVRGRRVAEYLKSHDSIIILEVLSGTTTVMDANQKPVMVDGKVVTKDFTNTKAFAKAIQELDASDLMSITYVEPPKKPRVSGAVKRQNTEICLHRIYGGTKNTTPGTNTEKWIYVEYPWKNKDGLQGLNDYTREQGVRVCGLADYAIKMIAGDPNFISLADYLAKFKPTNDIIRASKAHFSSNLQSWESLNSLKGLKDKFLTDMVEEYREINKSNKVRHVPTLLADKIAELDTVKEFIVRDNEFGALMKDQYPLINELGSYSRLTDEMAAYINLKLAAKKK